MNISYKQIDRNDYTFMREMLYVAVFVPEGQAPYPETIVDIPEISKYIDCWDDKNDFGIIVLDGNSMIGAAWCRLFNQNNKGFGYVADNIPELCTAIKSNYRNLGIGRNMMIELFKIASSRTLKAISLSVDKRNRAVDFYKKLGFEIINELKTDYTMLLSL